MVNRGSIGSSRILSDRRRWLEKVLAAARIHLESGKVLGESIGCCQENSLIQREGG
jgi:hypothetical protein